MLVFDMCICGHSFVYPVYIMIDITLCTFSACPIHAVFEYNNLNIVDRVVKIRGKYFRGFAMTVSCTAELGEGVMGGVQGGVVTGCAHLSTLC